ncbi:dehydrodolichyl diphosphate synthase 6 [Ricinus communis]|uniref:Alkyl transferase n=1 Tax=Ricinus communis TaxID=3988 RepID=B9T1V4_RICCO|nr:dehydrodolichyl diphosphate synthase 6 [Ricinus communis]EEF30154.1 undecaprenyl diphosphate synthase, putative [Ricinus communis]|eukprot:XP_002532223.1 dehydrodolichyl diphosphate synthase 6 [Ricinus communis]
MEVHNNSRMNKLFGHLASFMRRSIFRVLCNGPIPSHLSVIMDGNRRFTKKENLKPGAGYRAGFSALMSMLKYCYELGVKYVTIFAFGIDNFKRRSDEVQVIMDLMLEKTLGMLKEESIVHQYGVRVYFIGNLKLLDEPLRVAAEKVMRTTSNNTKFVLLICVAYSSTDEIAHAVQESCQEKWKEIEHSNSDKVSNDLVKVEAGKNINNAREFCKEEADELQAGKASSESDGVNKGTEEICNEHSVTANAIQRSGFGDKWDDEGQPLWETRSGNSVSGNLDEEREKMQSNSIIKQVDLQKHMYMAVAPDPDILIRTAGETRLSNFLLWQAGDCPLYSPDVLWPEFGLRHLVWAVLNFQRSCAYSEKKKKQL